MIGRDSGPAFFFFFTFFPGALSEKKGNCQIVLTTTTVSISLLPPELSLFPYQEISQ